MSLDDYLEEKCIPTIYRLEYRERVNMLKDVATEYIINNRNVINTIDIFDYMFYQYEAYLDFNKEFTINKNAKYLIRDLLNSVVKNKKIPIKFDSKLFVSMYKEKTKSITEEEQEIIHDIEKSFIDVLTIDDLLNAKYVSKEYDFNSGETVLIVEIDNNNISPISHFIFKKECADGSLTDVSLFVQKVKSNYFSVSYDLYQWLHYKLKGKIRDFEQLEVA